MRGPRLRPGRRRRGHGARPAAAGWEVVVADDRATDAARARAAELGVELVERPDRRRSSARGPGRPGGAQPRRARAPPALRRRGRRRRAGAQRDRPGLRWEQERPGGPRPMLAVTGTDGKTTTTLLATAMLDASGRASRWPGNTDVPLVSALEDRRRRVRRGVHQLPAGVDRALPARRRDVAEPRARSPRLAPVARDLRAAKARSGSTSEPSTWPSGTRPTTRS